MTKEQQDLLVEYGEGVGLRVRAEDRGGVLGVSYGNTFTADANRAVLDLNNESREKSNKMSSAARNGEPRENY